MSHPVAAQLVGDQHPRRVLQAGEQFMEEPGSGLMTAWAQVALVSTMVKSPPSR